MFICLFPPPLVVITKRIFFALRDFHSWFTKRTLANAIFVRVFAVFTAVHQNAAFIFTLALLDPRKARPFVFTYHHVPHIFRLLSK